MEDPDILASTPGGWPSKPSLPAFGHSMITNGPNLHFQTKRTNSRSSNVKHPSRDDPSARREQLIAPKATASQSSNDASKHVADPQSTPFHDRQYINSIKSFVSSLRGSRAESHIHHTDSSVAEPQATSPTHVPPWSRRGIRKSSSITTAIEKKALTRNALLRTLSPFTPTRRLVSNDGSPVDTRKLVNLGSSSAKSPQTRSRFHSPTRPATLAPVSSPRERHAGRLSRPLPNTTSASVAQNRLQDSLAAQNEQRHNHKLQLRRERQNHDSPITSRVSLDTAISLVRSLPARLGFPGPPVENQQLPTKKHPREPDEEVQSRSGDPTSKAKRARHGIHETGVSKLMSSLGFGSQSSVRVFYFSDAGSPRQSHDIRHASSIEHLITPPISPVTVPSQKDLPSEVYPAPLTSIGTEESTHSDKKRSKASEPKSPVLTTLRSADSSASPTRGDGVNLAEQSECSTDPVKSQSPAIDASRISPKEYSLDEKLSELEIGHRFPKNNEVLNEPATSNKLLIYFPEYKNKIKKSEERQRLSREQSAAAAKALGVVKNAASQAAQRSAEKIRERELKAEEEQRRLQAEREAEESRLQAEKEAEEARIRIERTREHNQTNLMAVLNEEWHSRIADAQRMRDPQADVAPRVTRHDLGTLLPLTAHEGIGWLNDTIIVEFMNLAVRKGQENGAQEATTEKSPKFHAFNSHLYTKWTSLKNRSGTNPYSGVARWVEKAGVAGPKLLKTEMIFIPINEHSHWTLLAVSGKDKTISYYDSLGGKGSKYLAFAIELVAGTLGDQFERSEWTVEARPSARQVNGTDCGAFVCMNTLALVKRLDPQDALEPEDMLPARRQIAAVLMNGGFGGEFDF